MLRILPSTFWLRLRVNVRNRKWLRVVALGLLAPVPFLLFLSLLWDAELIGKGLGVYAAWAEVGSVALVCTFALVATVVASLFRPAVEAALPHRVTFSATTIRVEPRNGSPFETDWDWVVSARASGETIAIVLAEHRAELEMQQARVGLCFEQLKGWLVDHGKIIR